MLSDAQERGEWIDKLMPVEEAVNSFLNYKDEFLSLNLLNLKYGYWDVKREKVLDRTDVKRNKALVKTIFQQLPNTPLFIIAGARHLPLEDLFLAKKLNQGINIPENYDDYYSWVEEQEKILPKQRSSILRDNAGATEIIFKSLKDKNIGFFQAIPLKSLDIY